MEGMTFPRTTAFEDVKNVNWIQSLMPQLEISLDLKCHHRPTYKTSIGS